MPQPLKHDMVDAAKQTTGHCDCSCGCDGQGQGGDSEHRQGEERRNVVDRRLGLDRRRGPGRRRTDNRRSAEEGQMTEEQFEFLMAIEQYKKSNSRSFPTWTEVLDVIKALGYRKVAEPTDIRNV